MIKKLVFNIPFILVLIITISSCEKNDNNQLKEYVHKNKSLKNYHGESITKEEFFSLECDIVIPAALELVICGEEANHLNCKLVLEAANGPLDMEADEICKKRDIEIIPDILANSGGVIVSYYEWLQNRKCEYWKQEDVLTRLDKKMIETYIKVSEYSTKNNVSLRQASYILSLRNIEKVYSKKGFSTF